MTEPVVFVSRDVGPRPDPARRAEAVEPPRSGRLLLLEPGATAPRTLVDAGAPNATADAPIDVMDPDVSYDAARIVFSGFSPTEGAWRIYEIGADGAGLRRITRSDRDIDLDRYGPAGLLFSGYDDVDPVYLPDGRIVFVSTRYPGVAPDGRRRTTNLYVVNADGTDLHRITSERFGADTPAVEPATGRIVYSRWWRSSQAAVEANGDPVPDDPEPVPPGSPGYGDVVDPTASRSEALASIPAAQFPGLNSWFLAGIDPDGTDLAMFTGFRLDRERTQAYRPSFLPSGDVIALFIPETPLLGAPGRNGLRRFGKGPGLPAPLGGPDRFTAPRLSAPFYASAEPVSEDLLLVSVATSGGTNDYDLFLQPMGSETLTVLYGESGRSELDAVVLAPRPTPPVIPETTAARMSDQAPRTAGEAFREGGRFTFLAENIFFNAPVDFEIANAPPTGRRLAIEFYMNPQRSSASIADEPILLERVLIPPDGRVEVELPAGVPLFEVLRLPSGDLPVGRDGQIFHVGGMNFGVAGETARCAGCHAGHSQLAVGEDVAWSNIAPSADITATSTRESPDQRLDPASRREFLEAANLLDRSTRNAAAVWAAREASAALELRWGSAVRARELVLYGPREDVFSDADLEQRIEGFGFATFLEGRVQESGVVSRRVDPEGTAVELDGSLLFDTLAVSIRRQDVSGLFAGEEGPALAELAVIGQGAGEPRGHFLRGDADCDGALSITDPVRLFTSLFTGAGALCCEAAADADGSGALNVSDAVFSLSFLFLGGRVPPQPFPACGAGTSDALSCDQEICPAGDASANAPPVR